MLRAIVFDFDGVIVDSEPLHYRAFLRIGESFGFHCTYDDYLQRYIGFDDRDALRAMLRDAGREEASDDAAIAALVLRKGDAFEAVVNEGIEVFHGTVEFIRQASAAVPVAIASGATRRDVDLILGKLGIAGLFDPVITADMVSRSKPDPETYRLAARELAKRPPGPTIEPGNCLAIEDTAAGIESARLAGLKTMGLATTMGEASLRCADRVVPTLEGLTLRQLRQWFD
jgi:HAD superfamily hydrolase (TIGR01509 family)